MKNLQTQFDDKRLSNAVATPTCSSCCCCCCCLATSISMSSLLTQRINKEAKNHQIPDRYLLNTLAALFIPITGLLVYVGFWTINSLLSKCTEYTYDSVIHGSHDHPDTYTICTNPGTTAIWFLIIIVPMLVLWYLYARVHIKDPARRSALVIGLFAAAFALELFGGAALILTGAGGIVYLVLVPIIIGWISVWYHKHLGKEDQAIVTANVIQPTDPSDIAAAQLFQTTAPTTEQATDEQHDNNTTEEPPQQNTPSTSAQ